MTNVLTHKGYTGTIEHDLQDNWLFGEVLFINDVISYQGRTLSELDKAFRNAVEDYLDTCSEFGRQPDKPFSGSFNVRVEPQQHKSLALRATEMGSSLNAVVIKAIEQFLEHPASQVNHTHYHSHVYGYSYGGIVEASTKTYTHNVIPLNTAKEQRKQQCLSN